MNPIDWIAANKEWLFSGVGLAALAAVARIGARTVKAANYDARLQILGRPSVLESRLKAERRNLCLKP